MKNFHIHFIYFIFSVLLSVTGCSSGGGDSAPAALIYSGNSDPAVITLANAPTLLVNVLYGGEAAANIPTGTGVSISVSETDSGNAAAASDHVVSLLHYSMDNFIGSATSGYYIPQGLVINETVPCDSGHFTLNGTVDDFTGMGTIAVSYVNCVLDGTTYNGVGTMTMHYIDIYTLSFSATVDFALLTMTGPDFSGSMSGAITIDLNIYGNQTSETITLNMVARNDALNKMYKFDNYSMISNITDIYYLYSSKTQSINGTVYDSILGGISVQTMSPLYFSSLVNPYPESGGPVVMTGNNSRMQLTVESDRHVLLELDRDNSGDYEIIRYVLWQEIEDHTKLDLTDSDDDGMHNSWESQSGLDPNVNDAGDDPDIDTFINLDEYQAGSDPQNPSSTPTNP